MPLYEFECPACLHRQEELQEMNDRHTARCEACGANSRRLYSAPMLTGDLPTIHGGIYNYYDTVLEKQIGSRQQRKDEMERQGIEPFVADPLAQKMREENEYIKKQSRAGSREAKTATNKNMKAAQDKIKTESICKALDKPIDAAATDAIRAVSGM